VSSVAEIESAIERLPAEEQWKLCEWLVARVKLDEPVMARLRKLSGRAKGLPGDLAINHDFYIHGAEKREEW
jgi:hypothetical protein